jgi:predicted RNA-binding protein (virulence factor B family)
MISIGIYNNLQVTRFLSFGAFLSDGEEEVLLPGPQIPDGLAVGDELRVFIYKDSEDRLIATVNHPVAVAGQFVALKVVDLTPHGTFVDWGLERDLLIPFGEQQAPMAMGQWVVVHISVHEESRRLMGSTRLDAFFDFEVGGLSPGQEVELLVYDFNMEGARVVIDGKHRGIVYRDQTYRALAAGDCLPGWVQLVRDDGLVDVSLQRPGVDGVEDARSSILRALAEAEGLLPLHDKSSPEDIRQCLGMSKKLFKKAIGGLYRDGEIRIDDDGIRPTQGEG